MWIVYFTTESCCDELRFYSVWSFIMLTAYFSLGVFVSSTDNFMDRRSLNYAERAFVILYEVAFPTVFVSFFLFWVYIRADNEYFFPSNDEAWNSVYTILNPILMLVEFWLNRILMVSKRWYYLTYWSLGYAVFVIITELIKGNDYHIYSKHKFLKLQKDSIPFLLQLYMLHFVIFYGCVFLGSVKQAFWFEYTPEEVRDLDDDESVTQHQEEPLISSSS